MKPVLTPDATAVVRCVRETLENWIAPALKGQSELSYVTTASHLLAYVERRIDREGQMLFDEIRHLHALLPDALAWLVTQPDTQALHAAISRTLRQERDPAVYPSLALVAEEVAMLRQHVCDLLELLHAAERDGPSAAGQELHAALRAYIAWQLEQEGKVVEPAFRGKGPRR